MTLDILTTRCILDVDGFFFGQIFGDAIVVVNFVQIKVIVIVDMVLVVVVIDDVDVMSAIMLMDPLTSICSLCNKDHGIRLTYSGPLCDIGGGS